MPLFGLFLRRNSTPPAAPPTTPTERDETGALASAITRAGMAGPASVALRIVKPLSWMGGQVLWILDPLLGTLGMRQTPNLFSLPGLAALLEREDSIDDLIARLEDAPNQSRN